VCAAIVWVLERGRDMVCAAIVWLRERRRERGVCSHSVGERESIVCAVEYSDFNYLMRPTH